MPHIAGFRGVLPGAAKLGESRVRQADGSSTLDVANGLAANTLVRDAGRAIYRYHQVFASSGRSLTRRNLIVAVRLSAWSEGVIRPHERSTPERTDAELSRIRTSAAYPDPIVAGFRDPAGEVDRLLRKTEGGTPTLEVTTGEVAHRVWRVQDAELLGQLRHHFAPKKLHLLEGHDRYAAMLAYRDVLAAEGPLAMYSSANYCLASLVNLEDPALATAPRHRIIQSPQPIARDAVLGVARTHFIVEKLAGAAGDLAKQCAALADTIAHQPAFVAMFPGDRDAWKLTLSPDVSPFAEGITPHRALQKLDPVVVDGLFVARAVPGAQIATEIDMERARAALDHGASVVLIVRPLSVEQIIHVDEIGQLLPPGSTAFYPAVASGLVSMVVERDEDLV